MPGSQFVVASFLKRRCRSLVNNERVRFWAALALMWIAYVAAIELVAVSAFSERRAEILLTAQNYLHGFLDDLNDAPPLARWDSVWFYVIARDGYTDSGDKGRCTPAFLPLYPLSMRWLSGPTGLDLFTAGLWMSRLCLFATLALLAGSSSGSQCYKCQATAAPAALLAFPTAFFLASVYAESLFLCLTLGAFALARRQHCVGAAVCAFAAAATRIQGLALVAGLAVMGSTQWRSSSPRSLGSLRCFIPCAAGLAAYAAMVGYCAIAFGDPLYHFAIKRELWGQGFSAPWKTLGRAINDTARAKQLDDLGSLYTLLELPCIALAALVLVLLVVKGPRTRWPEFVFVGCSLGMSLFGGALGGMPRFSLVLFPAFLELAKLRRWPWLWHTYLIGGALLQACLIINYVAFRNPPP